MRLNRQLQHEILQRAVEAYPAALRTEELHFEAETLDVIKTIYYLNAHGLIEAVFSKELGYKIQRPFTIKATHKGLDFLADDGGLSAILGTVTIRFHEESLKQLIEFRLAEASLPSEEKSRLLRSVRELPAESIKHLTTRLLDLGMDNLPRAIELIRAALS